MVRYIKCPRCELNYINADTQEYCDVCIAEIKGNKLQFADLEEEDERDEILDEEMTELCPICGVNHVRVGENMCESCRGKAETEEEVDPEEDEEWKNYLEDDDDDLTLDDEELEEELKEELEEEDEESDDDYYGEDDDPLSDFEDDEFDDDDEDLDDEDDEDDDLF